MMQSCSLQAASVAGSFQVLFDKQLRMPVLGQRYQIPVVSVSKSMASMAVALGHPRFVPEADH